jgi:hypothetical protein
MEKGPVANEKQKQTRDLFKGRPGNVFATAGSENRIRKAGT